MEGQKEIKILLVDDHKMMRDGLRSIIKKQRNLKIVGEASNGKEAVKFARENDPDVIIMDVDMPVMGGIEATRQIKSTMPKVKIIALTLHDRPTVKANMYKAGASDFVLKDDAFESLCNSILKVANPEKGSLAS